MTKNKPQECGKRITDAVLAEMRRYVGDATPHPQNVQAALSDLVDARAELERCSDYAATLGIENDELRARVEGYAESYDILAKERNDLFIRVEELAKAKRELEERCNRYRGTLDEEMHLGMKYYDKYNALRDAVEMAIHWLKLRHKQSEVRAHLQKALTEGGGESREANKSDNKPIRPALKKEGGTP